MGAAVDDRLPQCPPDDVSSQLSLDNGDELSQATTIRFSNVSEERKQQVMREKKEAVIMVTMNENNVLNRFGMKQQKLISQASCALWLLLNKIPQQERRIILVRVEFLKKGRIETLVESLRDSLDVPPAHSSSGSTARVTEESGTNNEQQNEQNQRTLEDLKSNLKKLYRTTWFRKGRIAVALHELVTLHSNADEPLFALRGDQSVGSGNVSALTPDPPLQLGMEEEKKEEEEVEAADIVDSPDSSHEIAE